MTHTWFTGSKADQRQLKGCVWGFVARFESTRDWERKLPAYSRARFSYRKGQELAAQSLRSRQTHRKKPMEHGKTGANARTMPYKVLQDIIARRRDGLVAHGSRAAWANAGFDDKVLKQRRAGWHAGDTLSGVHWVVAMRKVLVEIRAKPYRGLHGHDTLGSDAQATFFHKQFLDRCWRSSTATRSAASVDLSNAPGTSTDGPNSEWEKPYDPPAP